MMNVDWERLGADHPDQLGLFLKHTREAALAIGNLSNVFQFIEDKGYATKGFSDPMRNLENTLLNALPTHMKK